MISLWTNDRKTQLTDPILLGNYVIDAEWKRYWIYNSGPESILGFTMSVDQGSASTSAYSHYLLAKEFNGHPQAYHDYMNPLRFKVLSAYSWTPFWMRPDIAKMEKSNNPNLARLVLSGEATTV
jgi:hypothetical protein